MKKKYAMIQNPTNQRSNNKATQVAILIEPRWQKIQAKASSEGNQIELNVGRFLAAASVISLPL